MVVVTGIASEAVIERSRDISRTASDNRMMEEYEWFAQVVGKMSHLNNHQFFNRLATRPEAEGLLRWCLYVLKGSSDLAWFCADARKVYSAPTSRQPHLLSILEEYE